LQEAQDTSSALKGDIEGEAGLPLVAKAKGRVGGEYIRSRLKGQTKSLSLTSRSAAIRQLRLSRLPLIIDDFHYLDRDFQGDVIRALKPLIFEGLPVVLIAIPHRRYDAVKVEREMTGRLEAIHIPAWEAHELLQIASEGFPLLNMEVSEPVTRRFAAEAYGSPHLMQEFCKELAKRNEVHQTVPEKCVVANVEDELFKKVAEGTGKIVFDRLAKGPRQRADRIQRELKSGETGDIYRVTLYALARLGPGLDTIEYEHLRGALRDILAESIPQAHEITRVLEKMAEIAAGDEASTPVLDWEKEEQKLHITDPFFAFYLKWGVTLAQQSS